MAITGADHQSYRVKAADVGKRLTAKVTVVSLTHRRGSTFSAATAPVAP